MQYSNLIKRLQNLAEPTFRAFQEKLIPTKQTILGVRTPIMRKIAKEYLQDIATLFAFPDTYYEVTFIKLSAVSLLPYKQFINYVTPCVARMDNWATCDCFKAKCLLKSKDKFLPILEDLFNQGGEFFERYVLVCLLSYYTETKYLPIVEHYLSRAHTKDYYVHMAAAWLTAELLIKQYDFGVRLLRKGVLDKNTHNQAIQKAVESYRLTNEKKQFLRTIKIK